MSKAKALLALTLAGTLIAPRPTPANGIEHPVDLRMPEPLQLSVRKGPLVPVHFDKSLWLFGHHKPLSSERLRMLPKIDSLSPFLLEPANPAARFSSIWRYDPAVAAE